MFGTLRYDPASDNTEFADRAYSFLNDGSGYATQHSACNLCRTKKLRCSGEKAGCGRCTATSSTCVYPTDGDEGRLKRRRRRDTSSSRNNLPQNATVASISQPSSASRPLNQISNAEPSPPFQQDLQRQKSSYEDNKSVNRINILHKQEAAMQMLAGEFGKSNEDIFGDILPNVYWQTPKSSTDAPSTARMEIENEPISSINRALGSPGGLRTWRSSPHQSTPISSDDQDYFPRLPSPTISPLQSETALQQHSVNHSQPFTNLPPTPPHHNCNCLQTVVTLLEEVEAKKVTFALDSALATHKEYVIKCGTILSCRICMSKSESVMLLVLVYEKLVCFCEEVGNAYLRQGQSQAQEGDVADSAGTKRPKAFFGRYGIDSGEEWDCLAEALTLFQAKALWKQLMMIRKPASVLLRGGQISKLLTCERKLRALAESLRSSRALTVKYRA